MFEYLSGLYARGVLTTERLRQYVGTFLTPAEYQQITGEPYTAKEA